MMKNSPSSKPLIILFILAVSCVLASAAYTQTPQSLRETIIYSIKDRAQQDAQAERSRATPQDLSILFGKDAEASGLTMQDVMRTYDEAYQATILNKPWWKVFLPNAGWIVAIILSFLLILQEAFRKAISGVVEKIGKKFYKHVAGYKLFQKKALKNYKKALVKKYQHFKIPFRSERDLDMSKIYIPLKIKGSNDADLINDSDIVERFKHIVVIGAPGSGKSMLLKRIALSYALRNIKALPNEKTPILLDLRRFNEGDKSLVEHLVEILDLNDFPSAGDYLELSLNQGKLLLLFDGLDEVDNSKQGNEPTKRERAVKKIIDLLDRYENCPAIITCRTAVYRRDFDEIAERTLEIVEFSDQQIQSFLKSWPEPPPDKPIEQLITSLSERPAILALARNPLLLTIVAFLYTDMEEFVLPYSRSEFYTQAVDVLLQQLKGKLNRYRVTPKLLVLEHLALFNQEKDPSDADRLTLDEQAVLTLINNLLPSLNLEPKDAHPLLEEIVERSNLLLEVDNKTRYQFFHLTLQEFFAATALRNDAAKLLDNFKKNKDAWRETVKLWCGLPHNSTELINAIFRLDPLTAFECLADAPMVDQDTADNIIDHYKPLLGAPFEQKDAIMKAFAGVATGRSQRGRAVLSFLVDTLNTSQNPQIRQAAAEALALSNKQDAVIALSDRYDSDPDVVRPAIIKMGDIAVPSLKPLAENGHLAAINALQAIGTAKAAAALIPLLWNQQEDVQKSAAVKLAQIIAQRNGLDGLRGYALTQQQKAKPWYDWVWEPFEEPHGSPVSVITGRVAYILDTLQEQPGFTSGVKADWRIIVPMVLQERDNIRVNFNRSFNSIKKQDLIDMLVQLNAFSPSRSFSNINDVVDHKGYLKDLYTKQYFSGLGRASSAVDQQGSAISVKQFLAKLGASNRLAFLVELMPPTLKFQFIPCLIDKTQPSLDHWRYIMQPKRPFRRFGPFILLLLLILILSLISVREIITVLLTPQSLPSWKGISYLYLNISLLAGWATIAFGLIGDAEEPLSPFSLIIATSSVFVSPLFLVIDLINSIKGKPGEFKLKQHIQLFLSVGFSIAITYIASLHLLRYFSGKVVVAFWLVVAIFVLIIILTIRRHINRYDNPLRSFLMEAQLTKP